MATVLHRATLELRESVHTPDFDPTDWVIEPDLAPVVGVERRYWKLAGDVLSAMDQAERDAVDLALVVAQDDSRMAQLDTRDAVAALALVLLDEINLHAARVTAILDAIDNAGSFAAVKTAVAAIPDVPTRTVPQLKSAIRTKLESL